MYVKAVNGLVVTYPYGPSDLRRDYPNTSFPSPMTDGELAGFDVYPVETQNPPSFNQITENCTRINPTFDGQQWVETWSVTPATSEQIAQRTDEKAAEVRAERNQRLASCDWTQLQDAPVDHTIWAYYRQQLRDITDQPGFPTDVIWPSPPGQ